ncbi:MAG: hypothetical protein QOH57_1286 [Mycobacterium sp.]|nr:hypothetical protein [Mycobacterium sp.]
MLVPPAGGVSFVPDDGLVAGNVAAGRSAPVGDVCTEDCGNVATGRAGVPAPVFVLSCAPPVLTTPPVPAAPDSVPVEVEDVADAEPDADVPVPADDPVCVPVDDGEPVGLTSPWPAVDAAGFESFSGEADSAELLPGDGDPAPDGSAADTP